MTSNVTITFNGTYIRVEHSPGYELTEKAVSEFCQDLTELCRRHQCSKVLAIWVAPIRSLSVMNSFESGEMLSRLLSGVKLACCFQEYEPDKQTEFFANVAFNRGVNIELFTKEKEALCWLVGASAKQGKPGEF